MNEKDLALHLLVQKLVNAWSAETSVNPAWSKANPTLGQCAVTALVVQDVFGGELLRCTVGGVSHYWNRLADGTEIDLTRDQFDAWAPEGVPQVRTRDYVLSFPATFTRYELLKVRLT